MTKKGFTFIEFLVVVAVIFIVSSVLLANWKEARQKAHSEDNPGEPAYTLDLSKVALQETKEPTQDTIGMFFCIDVSGSMAEKLGSEKKIDISKNAMRAVFKQIDGYARANPHKRVKVGICKFSNRVTMVRPLLPFDLNALNQAVASLQVAGNTAIGEATRIALEELLKSNDMTKAILVMTDGENNFGVSPDKVVQAIKQNANNRKVLTAGVELYLVAFDVKSDAFASVKTAGATVVESRDAASLQGIMTSLVEEVLLEAQ